MPIPKPNAGEREGDFIGRCVSVLVDEGTDQEQAIAICYSQWEDNKTMDVFDNKKFATRKELFEFLKENKDSLLAQKKSSIKYADGCSCIISPMINKNIATKAILKDSDNEIRRKLVINTTNVLDSHGDVHLPGIWDKSLKDDNKRLLLQEHKMQFDYVIAKKKDVIVSTINTTFKDLGYSLEGETQALVFDVIINKEQNPKMFDRYKNGDIDNHSVGMQYVKIVMAINSDESWAAAEKEVWDKYYPEVRNKELANERGYFWVVKEAKVTEGSAVLVGSNQFTPVLEDKNEPSRDTHKSINEEPLQDTLSKDEFINLLKKSLNG